MSYMLYFSTYKSSIVYWYLTFKYPPPKPLNQIKPNLLGMVPGWVPFEIVSDSLALHSRCRFSVIWFSGFRGEDLNVIFYQNIPNLHNRYKSAERKITRKNPKYMLNYSLPCRCRGPFQNCVRQPCPLFKMAAFTKNINFFNCPLLL
jgi:hypothetical protein